MGKARKAEEYRPLVRKLRPHGKNQSSAVVTIPKRVYQNRNYKEIQCYVEFKWDNGWRIEILTEMELIARYDIFTP